MNGFISFGEGTSQAFDEGRIAPLAPGVRSEVRRVGKVTVLTWGSRGGDICIASREGKSHLVLSGYITECPDGSLPVSNKAAGDQLLHALDEGGSDDEIAVLCQRLSGSFGIYYHNEAADESVCISDRVGSRSLWTHHDGLGWLISSHPAAIALSRGLCGFDLTALAAFLCYGAAIQPTRSLFAGVKGVQPGTILRLNSCGSVRSHRWYRFRHTPDEAKSGAEWVDVVCSRVLEAASRLVQSRRAPVIFFSGGADSRLAAAALKAVGGDPLLVTLGDRENMEVLVARAAAKAMKLRHEVIRRDSEWYLRAFFRAVYEAGGSYVFTHGHFSPAVEEVRARFEADAFLLGDFFEAFSKLFCSADGVNGRMWTPDEFEQQFDYIRLSLYRPQNKEGALSLLKASIREEAKNALRREIRERYLEVSSVSAEPLVVGDYCFRWESAPTLPTFYMFADLRAVAPECNLMFDRGLHEVLQTIPGPWRNGRNLGAAVISRMARTAAWVPNSNSLLPMCWPPALHRTSSAVKPHLGKLRRRFLGNTQHTTGSWPRHSALYLANRGYRKHFGDTLQDGDLFDDQLFEPDAVRRCWEAFLNGDSGRVADVEKLAQLGQLNLLLRLGGKRYLDLVLNGNSSQ